MLELNKVTNVSSFNKKTKNGNKICSPLNKYKKLGQFARNMLEFLQYTLELSIASIEFACTDKTGSLFRCFNLILFRIASARTAKCIRLPICTFLTPQK